MRSTAHTLTLTLTLTSTLTRAQDAIYRSQPYRRAIAIRRWGMVRAAVAPLAHTHAARLACSWRGPRRWVAYTALFAMAVLPEARIAGLLYLGIFVLLLYREQGVEYREQGVESMRGGGHTCTPAHPT